MASPLANSTTMSPETAAAQSGTYRLLARLWLREVDRDLLRELRSQPLSDAYLRAGGALPASDDDLALEELAIDYCRLFVGPRDHLPPYQSVWQSGQFQGASAASMKSFIEIVGYDLDQLPDGIMLDHLGVQLDVMAHILAQISTWQSDAAGFGQLLELADFFLTRHLRWPTELLQAARRRAATDFYRSAIMLTGNFLGPEMLG